jgi:hypothetical protein
VDLHGKVPGVIKRELKPTPITLKYLKNTSKCTIVISKCLIRSAAPCTAQRSGLLGGTNDLLPGFSNAERLVILAGTSNVKQPKAQKSALPWLQGTNFRIQ